MKPKKAGIWFALATILIDAIGVGIIFPIMPDLLLSLDINDVSDAAYYGGLLLMSYALMQFIFSPVIGGLSDRYGRRPVLLLAIGAMVVDYLIMGFATSYAMLFIGRVLAGIAGATVATASAYIADISTAEDRSKSFGLIGATFGIGFIIGPILGGVIGDIGIRYPFFLAAGLSLLNLGFGWWFVPESLTKRKRRRLDWKRANPFGAFIRLVDRPELRGISIALFLLMFAGYVYASVWSFYGKEVFGWNNSTIGLTLALFGAGAVISQGILIKPVLGRLGERRTVLAGNIIFMFTMAGLAMATQPWMVFALLPFAALAEISGPALGGYTSNLVPDNEQGELQGLFASVEAVAAIISPAIMTGLFAAFTARGALPYFPGAPFLAAAMLVVVAVVILARTMR